MRLIILSLACIGFLISDRCRVRFATLVDNKRHRVHMNQRENCQARYRSNTWMGRTRTDGPDEFEPTKFDCIPIYLNTNAPRRATHSDSATLKVRLVYPSFYLLFSIPTFNCCNLLFSSSNIFFFSSSDICIELLPAIVLIAELKPDGLKKRTTH